MNADMLLKVLKSVLRSMAKSFQTGCMEVASRNMSV